MDGGSERGREEADEPAWERRKEPSRQQRRRQSSASFERLVMVGTCPGRALLRVYTLIIGIRTLCVRPLPLLCVLG